MATIVKPIDAKSIHQIQSGQVIVDLCSVVKELVENSLDAGAKSVEVRFKNNGLDEIEVQDDGAGIASVDYESVALKHYTSKLSTYDDLSALQTFGFRGEALSSLCALSTFTLTTARSDEAPKGHRLEFETSGRLNGTSIVACQRGTTATVQNLFDKLPVRRKELAKNIKREYGKVLGLLHAYACISTNVKFTVRNAMPKGKSMTVFATKSNTTTRENIANVYGAKTLVAIVALELDFDFQQSHTQKDQDAPNLTEVTVRGHISKPVFGEGRQTPDRQMFFVNGRPCGLPQIAKAINETYKSFNASQSPFIFADFQMDTGAYDVNVSPDKRTILLHDANILIDRLKTSLTELFDQQDHTVPQSHLKSSKLPAFKQLSLQRESSADVLQRSFSAGLSELERVEDDSQDSSPLNNQKWPSRLLHDHFQNLASTREEPGSHRTGNDSERREKERQRRATKVTDLLAKQDAESSYNGRDNVLENLSDSPCSLNNEGMAEAADTVTTTATNTQSQDIESWQQKQSRADPRNEKKAVHMAEAAPSALTTLYPPEDAGAVPKSFDRMRPKRLDPEFATITIGDRTVTRLIGSQPFHRKAQEKRSGISSKPQLATTAKGTFAQGLQQFNAAGSFPTSQIVVSSNDTEDISGEENEQGQDHEESENDDSQSSTSSTSRQTSDGESEVHRRKVNFGRYDEDDERVAEGQRVSELIRLAEEDAAYRKQKADQRMAQGLKAGRIKESIASLAVEMELDLGQIERISETHRRMVNLSQQIKTSSGGGDEVETAEDRLSLTVSKTDFANMHIVGQFNLGFILAVRYRRLDSETSDSGDNDELFIIDQHASDEIYNFERLQAETVVGNQRMVRPATLDLTAVEEEIVIDNPGALEKNGFIIEVDTSGEQEVGRRCRLVSLPLSKEVVFGSQDLDELIHLLAESPMLDDSKFVPRPSKVRKMFAM